MASDLVLRLIAANENSTQSMLGSDIFYKAAERIDFLEEENAQLRIQLEAELKYRNENSND
jgi:hypothetical protein